MRNSQPLLLFSFCRLMLTSCSYLVDLEARIKAYEKDAEHEGSINQALSEAARSYDGPSAGSGDLPSPSVDKDKDDIDDNPLTEKIAHLVLSPEGDKRS